MDLRLGSAAAAADQPVNQPGAAGFPPALECLELLLVPDDTVPAALRQPTRLTELRLPACDGGWQFLPTQLEHLTICYDGDGVRLHRADLRALAALSQLRRFEFSSTA